MASEHWMRREQARANTLIIRSQCVESLLNQALEASNHWLAFDFVNAARVIWGKDHDSTFETLSYSALLRARQMQDSESAENARKYGGVSSVLVPVGLGREESHGSFVPAKPPGHPEHDVVRKGL